MVHYAERGPSSYTIHLLIHNAMNILTYSGNVEINLYDKMTFDYDKAMVCFSMEGARQRFYFESTAKAKEFIHEIIEALYAGAKEIDLSHFICVSDSYSISGLKSEIQKRIRTYSHEEAK